ncbi:pirin family protein [Roseateles sp. BYS87W]|uniref:Pirin family protein n=1 Tax=Pelomonas baiyunensis TaxID=3299026 RepID=A0ABW7GW42_9BURK
MLQRIKSCDRGYADHGWLKSFHSFSFADYYDPARMGFGALRVINEDQIAPGTGFGTHGHRDMEIISYVLSGELAHKDSMGNGQAGGANAGVIRPGDVQRMSAGSGVLHSEFNHAKDQTTHFLQIWIQPDADKRGIAPSYEQKHFAADTKRGTLRLVAASDGAEGAVTIHADARLYAGLFNGSEAAELALAPGRLAYVHLVRGALTVNGQNLASGDALQVRETSRLVFSAGQDAEVLVFDLAA